MRYLFQAAMRYFFFKIYFVQRSCFMPQERKSFQIWFLLRRGEQISGKRFSSRIVGIVECGYRAEVNKPIWTKTRYWCLDTFEGVLNNIFLWLIQLHDFTIKAFSEQQSEDSFIVFDFTVDTMQWQWIFLSGISCPGTNFPFI